MHAHTHKHIHTHTHTHTQTMWTPPIFTFQRMLKEAERKDRFWLSTQLNCHHQPDTSLPRHHMQSQSGRLKRKPVASSSSSSSPSHLCWSIFFFFYTFQNKASSSTSPAFFFCLKAFYIRDISTCSGSSRPQIDDSPSPALFRSIYFPRHFHADGSRVSPVVVETTWIGFPPDSGVLALAPAPCVLFTQLRSFHRLPLLSFVAAGGS